MNHDEQRNRKKLENLAGSLMLLSFGLAMLAYLIAIDRPEWFNLRPASGTAAAMSNAAQISPPQKRAVPDTTTHRIARVHGKAEHGTNP